MLAWLAARTGLDRFVICGLLTGLLLALAGLGAWGAVSAFRGIISDAVVIAVAARDEHWRGQIATANAAVQQARAEQALASAKADTEARGAEARFQDELKKLEKDNAALAGGTDLVLRRDRVRVLDGSGP